MGLLLCVVVIALSTALVWSGSRLLDLSAERLAAHHRLSPAVQGGVITAVGSSFPELSTAVLATWIHGAFELGVAAIVGSAVFNVLVIPSLSALAGGSLRFERDLVYRDAQFYVTSIAVLLLVFAFARIYRPIGPGLDGELTRPLALLPLALYGFYLFLEHQDSEDRRDRPPSPSDVRVAGEWGRLAVGLALILPGVEGLVRSALWLGENVGAPPFFWGATVVAAATSLPDALVSVRAARRGDGEVSLANAFGSNVFDLLVAVPAGVLVAGSAVVRLAVVVPMAAWLAVATLAALAAMRVGLRLGRGEALALLALYAAFVGWLALEAAGALRWTAG